MYVIVSLFIVLAALAVVIMYCALINASDCDDFEEKLRKKNNKDDSN